MGNYPGDFDGCRVLSAELKLFLLDTCIHNLEVMRACRSLSHTVDIVRNNEMAVNFLEQYEVCGTQFEVLSLR